MQHRVSAGALIEQDERILLVRSVLPGRYDFWVAPGGGVEGKETIEQAAAREVREESGLEVRVKKLAYVEELLGVGVRYCKFWFTAEVVGGTLSCIAPEAQQEHITEAAWLSRTELEGKVVFPTVLGGRYWSDRENGFESLVHLGLRRMELT